MSTGDDINLEQMLGQYNILRSKMPNVKIVPVAARMKSYGVDLAVLEYRKDRLEPFKYVKVIFDPAIDSWSN